MIPYTLIVTASHRPHLLGPTLESLLRQVDQPPVTVILHDDAVLPFRAIAPTGTVAHMKEETTREQELARRRNETKAVLQRLDLPVPVVYTWADPPRRLGLALAWILDRVETEYALYSQDDFVTVRPVPIALALATMAQYDLHQIRFNKRATVGQKETWQGPWRKQESRFAGVRVTADAAPRDVVCTVSDHWYFQTGLWRVAPIRAAIRWLTANVARREMLETGGVLAEEGVNHAMDGRFGPIPGLAVPEDGHDGVATHIRQRYQRTYIWGGIGEDRYIRHIGGADPTAEYPRDGGADDPARAWREIRGYGEDTAPPA